MAGGQTLERFNIKIVIRIMIGRYIKVSRTENQQPLFPSVSLSLSIDCASLEISESALCYMFQELVANIDSNATLRDLTNVALEAHTTE